MKNSKGLIASTSLLALSLTLLQFSAAPSPADARGGGGGGGGFRGGGFGGGGFGFGGRGDFGRGDFGGGDRGWAGDGGFVGNIDRNAASEDRPRASEGELRAGANQDYRFPTDGGFGRAAGQDISGSRITSNISPAGMATRGASVRNAFNHNDLFNRDFWNRYDRGWWYPGWGGGWYWGNTGWGDLCSFWGDPDSDEPVEYDYGNNITYQGDQVYYGNQPFESAADYYTQAQTLALSVPPSIPPLASQKATAAGTKSGAVAVVGTKAGASAKTSANAKTIEKESDWKPLGVFALTQGDQTDSNSIFQLAVSKKGVIRGNYYNPLTQEEQAVQGKLDKKSKRVAWTVGSNKSVVYDTGIANLLAKQSSLLIHLDKSKTQQWNLIRLQQNKST